MDYISIISEGSGKKPCKNPVFDMIPEHIENSLGKIYRKQA